MRRQIEILDRFKMGQIESLVQATLNEVGAVTYPIDLEAICRFNNIEIQAKPISSTGVSGMLIRSGNKFGIMYAQHINSIGFQRFSIAHEIGHYKIPGHPEVILDSRGIHESHAGFVSDQQFEKEADYFAANLLMPKIFFVSEIESTQNSLEAIKSLAAKFQTSLLSTAIRYTELTDDLVAVVVSNQGKIEWCSMSPAFKEISGLDWIRKNEPVPQNSISCNFSKNGANEQKDGCLNLQDWFNGPHDAEVTEEAMRIGNSDKILTMIYDINIPDEEETDECYEERWTPRFK